MALVVAKMVEREMEQEGKVVGASSGWVRGCEWGVEQVSGGFSSWCTRVGCRGA